MTPIKILHILPYLHKGGVEAFVMSYFRHINRSRYSFIFLVLGDGNEYESEIISLGGIVIHADISFSKAKYLGKNFLKMVKLLKNLDYDIIHSNVNQYNGLVFLASILAGKKGFVSHSHGTDFEDSVGSIFRRIVYKGLIYKLTSELSDVRLACGEKAGMALYNGADFKILRNAVDFSEWSSEKEDVGEELLDKYKIGRNSNIYTSISRYDWNKNLTFFVDIFKVIHEMDIHSHMIVGGTPGDYEEEVRNKVKEYGLEDSATILGSCDNMKEFYKLSDCWIMPSYNEGLPFSLIEAQACGLNVIVNDTVDRDADMGINLLHFCKLSDGPGLWAQNAIRFKGHMTDKKKIEGAMSSKGYSIKDNVIALESIYDSIICRKLQQ